MGKEKKNCCCYLSLSLCLFQYDSCAHQDAKNKTSKRKREQSAEPLSLGRSGGAALLQAIQRLFGSVRHNEQLQLLFRQEAADHTEGGGLHTNGKRQG